MTDNEKTEYQLEQLNQALGRLYEKLDDMDKVYVRLERYLIVERMVFVFILGVVGAAMGLVWTSVAG